MLLIAYSFVRLCSHFNHAGSVYGLIGATLGPRAGAVAAWGLLFTYIAYGLGVLCACGHFIATFLSDTGIWESPPLWSNFLFGAIVAVPVFLLASRPARVAMRTLLSIECITVLLIAAVAVVVLVKLLGGSTPAQQDFTLDVFNPPSGVDATALSIGLVFGFLSFAGFEAAASLGEETRKPRRDIPRAILGTAIFGGILYTSSRRSRSWASARTRPASTPSRARARSSRRSAACTSRAGSATSSRSASSSAPSPARSRASPPRLAWPMRWRAMRSRAARVARLSRNDSPVPALILVMAVALGIGIFYRLVAGSDGAKDPYTLYFYAATAGTIALLVAY